MKKKGKLWLVFILQLCSTLKGFVYINIGFVTFRMRPSGAVFVSLNTSELKPRLCEVGYFGR